MNLTLDWFNKYIYIRSHKGQNIKKPNVYKQTIPIKLQTSIESQRDQQSHIKATFFVSNIHVGLKLNYTIGTFKNHKLITKYKYFSRTRT